MPKTETLQRMVNPGIIAILRAHSSAGLMEAVEALLEGGIATMEVTLTTPDALSVIREARARFGSQLLMGVGSVIDEAGAQSAVDEGAQFVVTPVTKPGVVGLCNRLSVPIACGAFTPTEALLAHESGADFVKIFPADQVGPVYLKNLLAPLPMLRLIPTGGVTPENAREFLKAGAVALGVGSNLVSRAVLEARDWAGLRAAAERFVEAVRPESGA